MKVTQVMIFVIVLSVLGCKTGNKTVSTSQDGVGKQIGVGMDEHGCNKATGYTWSEVRKDCIRLFESGVRLNPSTDPDTTLSAFIVFSADSSKAELFLPNDTKHPILERKRISDGTVMWGNNTDSKQVRSASGIWVIEQRGKTLYMQVK